MRDNQEHTSPIPAPSTAPTPAPDGLSLKQNILWNSVGSFAYALSTWIITVLVVVLATDYQASGVLALSMAVGNIVAIIALMKVRVVQVSDVENRFLVDDYLGLRIITSAIALIFAVVYSLFTVELSALPAVLMYSVFRIAESLIDVFHGIDQRHDRLDYAGISLLVRAVLVLACFTGVFWLTQDLVLTFASMALITVLFMALYDIPRANSLDAVRFKPLFRNMRQLFRVCLSGFAASLLCTFVVSIARQAYGLEAGSQLLGIYAAVATPAVIIQALATFIYAPLLGPLARDWHQGNMRSIGITLVKFFALLALGTAACAGLSVIAGEWALTLVYGPSIAPYAWVLTPALVATGATGAMLFVLDYLVAVRGFLGAVLAAAASLLICLLLMNPCLAAFGMNGVNVIISVSYVAGTAVGLLYAIGMIVRRTRKEERA